MIAIDAARLRSRVETLARFGGLAGGGVTRPCWSPPYEEARAWLLGELRAAGLQAWVDPAGNVFGATAIGGFGAELGVLGGLEVLQTIREAKTVHRLPLAVAAWSDEEGRYGSLFGSRAFCGMLDLLRVEEMAAVDGERLVDAMARAGFDARRSGEATAPAGAIAAYVELHIEQGPRLEEAGIPIGVVDSIVGVRRSRVVFTGQADHAGTTPMERRRDGFLAAADYALKARDLVVKHGGGRSVTNFGVVHVHPGVSNIVPARGELVHEMRGPDAKTLEVLARRCASLASRVARRRGVGVELRPMSATAPALCAERVQAAIEGACATLGLGSTRLYSAAGHDAQNLAAITDAGMIFIPSKGGRSHRVDEMSDWDAIARGANVLLHALLALAA